MSCTVFIDGQWKKSWLITGIYVYQSLTEWTLRVTIYSHDISIFLIVVVRIALMIVPKIIQSALLLILFCHWATSLKSHVRMSTQIDETSCPRNFRGTVVIKGDSLKKSNKLTTKLTKMTSDDKLEERRLEDESSGMKEAIPGT